MRYAIKIGVCAAVMLLAAGCGPKSADSVMFNQPEVPFTFAYPPKFFNNAMIQVRPGQTLGDKPEYYFEIVKDNGIAVRQIGASEASSEEIINGLKSSVLRENKGDLQLEHHKGREMVCFQLDPEPPQTVDSKSFFFGYAGKTWQIEFYWTPTGRLAVDNASSLVIESIQFKATSASLASSSPRSRRPHSGVPADYFPIQTGAKWTYQIEIGDEEPLFLRIVEWSIMNGRIEETRGRLRGTSTDKSRKNFELVLFVARPAPTTDLPAEIQNAERAVEITVEKDELGIFKDFKRLFWTIQSSDEVLLALQVGVHDWRTGPRGVYGPVTTKDGFSIQPICLRDQPGKAVDDGVAERLVVRGEDGGQLHLARECQRSAFKGGTGVSAGFVEDMWFEKRKGLVRLEQKVEGKSSMVWKLAKFTR